MIAKQPQQHFTDDQDWKVVWRVEGEDADITVWERVSYESRWDVEINLYDDNPRHDGITGNIECSTFAEVLAVLRDAKFLLSLSAR